MEINQILLHLVVFVSLRSRSDLFELVVGGKLDPQQAERLSDTY